MDLVHPVSFCVTLVAHVMQVARSRVEQRSRPLLHAGLLPMTSGRGIKKVGADKLLLLVAAAAHAETIFDSVTVATAFAEMPLAEGVEPWPGLKHWPGAQDPVTLGGFFTSLIEEKHRLRIGLELIKYAGVGEPAFAASIEINGNALEFGAERPSQCGRATAERITVEGFSELRHRFRHGEAAYARAFQEAAQ